MSEHEAAARYEHATTLLDWHHAIDAPPPVKPPTGDDGWMLFSQTPTPSASGDVTRFLCVWRRRLVRVEDRKPTRADWKFKKQEEARQRAEYQAEQQRARLEREEREKKAWDARVASRTKDAWQIGPRVWESVKHIPGVRALGFSVRDHVSARWALIFQKGIDDRHEKTREANHIAKQLGLTEYIPSIVNWLRRPGLEITIGSNDPRLPVDLAPNLAVKVPESSPVDWTETPVTRVDVEMIANESVSVREGQTLKLSCTLKQPTRQDHLALDDDDDFDLFEGYGGR